MQSSKPMQDGWTLMSVILGENGGSQLAASYISGIEKEIQSLDIAINNTDTKSPEYQKFLNTEIEQQKGNVGEVFQTSTFNIDAAAKGAFLRAIRLGVDTKNSVDIAIVDIRKLSRAEWLYPRSNYDSIIAKARKVYQMKVYNNPDKAFNALSEIDPKTGNGRYSGMEALTASDTKSFLETDEQGINHVLRKTHDTRENVAVASKHTADTLTDKMEASGISSKSASTGRYKEMAKASRHDKKYNPEDDGITLENTIQVENIVKEALKGGATAATIAFILQFAPEVVKVIDYLVKHGEIDVDELKQFGVRALSSSVRSFLRGSIAAGLVISARKGLLGSAMATINPSVIGAMVAIVLDTVANSIKLSAGQISPRQMGIAFIDSTVISVSFLGSAKLGGVIGQTIAPQLPVIGFLIGSLIGCSVSVLYNVGKNRFISFCKATGFTCFGLVSQDYTVPEELLKQLGIQTASILRTDVERSRVGILSPTVSIGRTTLETVNYKMIKRGVIGANIIGYVL